jgi:hypothetical protein
MADKRRHVHNKRLLHNSVVFQNGYGVFEVKLYGFELAQDVESNEAVCVVEFEVPPNCPLTNEHR